MEQTASRTLYLVRLVQQETYARLEDRLRTFELTPGQFTVLGILESRDGLSAAQLARRMSVTPQAMNELIASLERRQLIARREAPENRRILEARLTAAGKKAVALCNEVVDRIDAEVFRSLKRGDLKDFRQMLSTIIADLRLQAGLTPEKSAQA